ncbi:hypothetical protein ACFL08_00620 [Patescibacteria group bacterium]
MNVLDRLDRIDSWIIKKLERMFQWTKNIFGLDNFWWARIMLIIKICIVLCFLQVELSSQGLKTWSTYYINYMDIGLVVAIFLGSFYFEAIMRGNERYVNVLRLMLQWPRWVIITATPCMSAFIIFKLCTVEDYQVVARSAQAFTHFFAIYAISCLSTPPSESKVVKWIKSAIERLSPAIN